ncbi:MAG: helix-turn-helix domain-containing protein, partial [Acidobacteria bacterium]|nr:helix-turn-helix domain-containing protein [Acidobacteriota bacterium]
MSRPWEVSNVNPAKTKSKKGRTSPAPVPSATPSGTFAEVLTLQEAAAYLRVPEAAVVRLIHQQHLPGRLIDQEWRFLKSALQDWLRTLPPQPSKEAVLARIGSWKDDPHLDEELREISRRRSRTMTEESRDRRGLSIQTWRHGPERSPTKQTAIPFATLQRVLKGLGFVRKKVDGP